MSETIDQQVARMRMLPREELVNHFVEAKHRLSMIVAKAANLRSKPLFGGTFGNGGFALASWWDIRGGLDHVSYFVLDTASNFVVGWGESKDEALEMSRMFMSIITTARLRAECAKHAENAAAWHADRQRLRVEAWEARRAQAEQEHSTVRSIPRRRRRIFDECGGKCHYCEATLTLDGTWHIEHKMPRALGGGNEPGNLVASCVPCNTRKRDTTDLEFKARLAKESA